MVRNDHARRRYWQRTDHTLVVSGLLGFVGGQNSPTAIGSTVRANPVCLVLGVALRALYQSGSADRIMRPTAVTASFGNLAFWQRSHVELSPSILVGDRRSPTLFSDRYSWPAPAVRRFLRSQSEVTSESNFTRSYPHTQSSSDSRVASASQRGSGASSEHSHGPRFRS